MSRTIESQLSWNEARKRMLAEAEPGEAIEVSLGEALGLVLAEPVEADVDHPPFDRASHDGYAVRAADATPGAFLRVVRPGRSRDLTIEAGEAGRVVRGDPIPPGTDAILRPSHVRPDLDADPTRVIEVVQPAWPSRDITPRGAHLSAGETVIDAGTRITPTLIPLLAAQGCVHPFCHRRVRVSIVAVGNRWVGPADAPTMNRERNATNAALVALTLRLEAMPHDFQAVAGSKIRPTLERAATSPVVVVIGAPSATLTRAWDAIGYEPVVAGVAIAPIGRIHAGVIRDDEGRVVNHIIHLPGDPVAASAGFALFVQPLIDRLQGAPVESSLSRGILADSESQPATRRRAQVVPASIETDQTGRTVTTLHRGPVTDLVAWSQATGFCLFPDNAGPWHGGAAVEYVPLGQRP